ncbi:MAG TPA: DUF2157 domain-containing protein [Candidatus Paceibacterota bacterium]
MDELVKKVESWVERGVINIRTARRILAAEGVNAEDALQIKSGGRVVSVISVLGAILVGLGIILFIGTNWAEISVTGKLGIISAAILIAYGAGYYLKYILGTYPRVGDALMLIGGISYGAGLFLVAQMFHTNANPVTLFFIWGAGLMPLMLFLRDELLYVLASIVFVAWSISAVFYEEFFGIFFSRALPQPHYWYFALWLFILLPITGYFRFKKGYAVNLLGFLVWFGITVVMWQTGLTGADEGVLVQTLLYYLFLGINLILIGRLGSIVASLDEFGFITRVLGGAAMVVPLYILSWNSVLFMYQAKAPLAGISLIVFYALAVLAVVLLALYFLSVSTAEARRIAWREGGILALIAVLAIVFYLFPVSFGGRTYYYGYGEDIFHPFVLPWNVALLAFNIMLIIIGYFERRHLFVNIGIIFFIIHVISRYFDIFALQLGTSFSFIVGGVLLLVLAVSLERFRRGLIKKMNETSLTSGVPQA